MLISQNPIFIVGFPRSGTTFLQSLLATQKNLTTFPETHFFNILNEKGISFNEKISKCDVDYLNNALGEKLQSENEILTKNENISVKDAFEKVLLFLWNKDDKKNDRWIEKTPSHALFMDEISIIYPDAKFIFIVRNPFNSILSNLKYFPPNSGRRWKDIIILANRWAKFINKAQSFDRKHPEKISVIRYEDLAASVPTQIKSICAYLDIEFNEKALENYHEKAKKAISPYEHWKKDVVESTIESVQKKSNGRLSNTEKLLIIIAAYKEMLSFSYLKKKIFLSKLNLLYKFLLKTYRAMVI